MSGIPITNPANPLWSSIASKESRFWATGHNFTARITCPKCSTKFEIEDFSI